MYRDFIEIQLLCIKIRRGNYTLSYFDISSMIGYIIINLLSKKIMFALSVCAKPILNRF